MNNIRYITSNYIEFQYHGGFYYASFDGCNWTAILETKDARHAITAPALPELNKWIQFYL